MKNHRNSNVNNRRAGQRSVAAHNVGRQVPGPNRRARPMRKETTSGIWRSPVLKPKVATQSPRKTTTSTPNIISGRCRRRERNRSDAGNVRLQSVAKTPNECNGLLTGRVRGRSTSLFIPRPPTWRGRAFEEGARVPPLRQELRSRSKRYSRTLTSYRSGRTRC